MARVFTVGHGTKTLDELLEILRAAGVTMLVDVRRFPGSKRYPHFDREGLEVSLPGGGVDYEWCGEGLGGRRNRRPTSRHPAWNNAAFQGYADHMDTDEFRTSLHELEADANRRATAVMCAETLWWKCHRRLIADALVVRGHDVVHLMTPGKSDRHKLHPNVRVGDDGWPVYDVNVDRPLGLA